jgi:hypothetical protein
VLNQIVQIAFSAWGLVLVCVLFIGLPFGWAQTCAAWHRAHGVSRKEAYFRAVAVPALLLLGGYFLVPTHANRTWVFWLLVAGTVAALVGVRWECRRYPEPPRLHRWWSEGDFPEGLDMCSHPVYECWKCGVTKAGFWQYEASVQDKKKQDHAFAWMPICEACAQKARQTPSGPSSE